MIFKNEGVNIKRLGVETSTQEGRLTKIDVREYLKQSEVDDLLRFRHNIFTNSRDDKRVPFDLRYFHVSAQLRACGMPNFEPWPDERKKVREVALSILREISDSRHSFQDVSRMSDIALMDPVLISGLSAEEKQHLNNRVANVWNYVTSAQRSGKNIREYLFWAKTVAPNHVPALTPELTRSADIWIPMDELQTMPDSSLMYFAEEYAILRVLDPSKKSPDNPLFWKRLRAVMDATKPDLSRLHYAFIARLLQAEQISVDEEGLHIIDFAPMPVTPESDAKPVPQRKHL